MKDYKSVRESYSKYEPYHYFDCYISACCLASQDNHFFDGCSLMHQATMKSFISGGYIGFHTKERKIITIAEDLIPLIEDTKPNFDNLKLKYPAMFINQKFKINDFIVNGIFLIDIKELNKLHNVYFEDDWESDIRVLSVILNTKDEYEFYTIEPLVPYQESEDRTCDAENEREYKDMQNISKKINAFSANLIQLMINDKKDIRYVEIPESEERNKKRAKRGKPPIKEIVIMKIGGELKRYASKYRKDRESMNIRYYVGGFFRHYDSDFYINKKGTKEWIYPFYKNKDAPEERITERIVLKKGK